MIGITTANLNVRTGTDTNYTSIAIVPKGTKVNILEENVKTGWCKIQFDEIYAFVSSKYVKIQSNKPSSKTQSNKEEYKNCINEQGIKDGHKYVYTLKNCKITAYGSNSSSACKIPLQLGHTCGTFNLPYNTKIYIPSMKGFKFTDGNGKTAVCDGVFICNDTGIGCADFDLYMSTYTDYNAERNLGSTKYEDVYILEYGKGYGYAWSYTQSYEFADKNNRLELYKKAFKDYIKNGGTLINFLKFKDIDKNIRKSTYWKKLNN